MIFAASLFVLLTPVNNTDADAKIRVNLQAQVVETKAEAKKKKPVERKKSTSDEPKAKRVRKAKDEKKSSASNNKPKRPLTAFFIFMNDFRKTFKEENPSSNVKDVAKQGGEKWKSLTEEEKKVYLDKAAELKAEYNKSLESSDADEEEEDEEKQSDDDANEKQFDEADGSKQSTFTRQPNEQPKTASCVGVLRLRQFPASSKRTTIGIGVGVSVSVGVYETNIRLNEFDAAADADADADADAETGGNQTNRPKVT
ncbi:high mobility group B protein 7-like [Raphanus sativus]|nr:high mobility group B protein 7-like [Raphanus sativus]